MKRSILIPLVLFVILMVSLTSAVIVAPAVTSSPVKDAGGQDTIHGPPELTSIALGIDLNEDGFVDTLNGDFDGTEC